MSRKSLAEKTGIKRAESMIEDVNLMNHNIIEFEYLRGVLKVLLPEVVRRGLLGRDIHIQDTRTYDPNPRLRQPLQEPAQKQEPE